MYAKTVCKTVASKIVIGFCSSNVATCNANYIVIIY